MEKPTPILRATEVRKRFDSEGSWVLDGVSLDASAGERIAIVGPSGSGKSTLLGILGTLETPTHGIVTLNGTQTSDISAQSRAELRRDAIGFIFQDHHLLPQCTALQNVVLPLLAKPGASITTHQGQSATELLSTLGLQDRLDAWPHQLSTGERQRVAVARALMGSPSLILADEPTGSLDRANTDTLMALLLDHVGDAALIVVTHSERVAHECDRILELIDGKLVPRASAP